MGVGFLLLVVGDENVVVFSSLPKMAQRGGLWTTNPFGVCLVVVLVVLVVVAVVVVFVVLVVVVGKVVGVFSPQPRLSLIELAFFLRLMIIPRSLKEKEKI